MMALTVHFSFKRSYQSETHRNLLVSVKHQLLRVALLFTHGNRIHGDVDWQLGWASFIRVGRISYHGKGVVARRVLPRIYTPEAPLIGASTCASLQRQQ